MDTKERKAHWETVFETKDTTQVSWYQPAPDMSLQLIEKLNIRRAAGILEVGSGDSFLGDELVKLGYTNVSLLDISEKALEVVKKRLGDKIVDYIAEDVTCFSAENSYELWHDRAVFHFLIQPEDVSLYVRNASRSLIPGGYLIISTFSDQGPDICSGLKVMQYSEEKISKTFSAGFDKVSCFRQDHKTPSGGKQNFLFAVFRKK